MKKIFLLMVAVCLAAQAQNASVAAGSVHADLITHSTARIKWQPGGDSGTWTCGNCFYRFRYIPAASGTCTSGSGGTVTQMDSPDGARHLQNFSGLIGGLSPSTTYNVCPEGSVDGGNTYYGGVSGTFTTAPLPSPHPASPVAPTRFNTNYPDTTGYTTVTEHLGDDCSSLTGQINTALSHLKDYGTIINVDAGSSCLGYIHPSQVPPDVTELTSSAFNTSTYTITTPTNHNLSEGQQIVWATRAVPGSYYTTLPGQGGDRTAGPVITGHPVWAHVTGANTFQVYYGAPYGSPCQDESYFDNTCPHLWQFSDSAGGHIMYAPYPRNMKWVIVRTSTPDSQFVPEHVRVNPNWAPKMAKLMVPWASFGYPQTTYLFSLFATMGGAPPQGNVPGPYDDPANTYMLSNIRFVGMELTYQPYPQAATTSDPPPGQKLIYINSDASNIIFDRCYIHGYPTPFRVYTAIEWNGSNMGLIDSDIRDMHYWRFGIHGVNPHL